jgi:hypothetical protein
MPPIAAATVLMDYFTQVSGTELLANILLLHTNVLGVTWSLQVEMVGSLAIFAMWLWGRDSLPKMMAAVAVAIASVLFLRGTVLVYQPAFALGGLISSIPASVWRSRALFWCGLALLLTANLFFFAQRHNSLLRDRWCDGRRRLHGNTATQDVAITVSAASRYHQLSTLFMPPDRSRGDRRRC